MFVFKCLAVVQPRIGIEQQFQRPAVSHTLGEAAVAVGVGIDESGDQEHPVGVDDLGFVVHCESRGCDFGNPPTDDEQIPRLRTMCAGIENSSAANEAGVSHSALPLCKWHGVWKCRDRSPVGCWHETCDTSTISVA